MTASKAMDRSELHRVELHNHFEGALRPSTVYDMASRRGHQLPVGTVAEFAEFIRRKQPSSLADFLSYFPALMSMVAGDAESIRRLAVDFVEDCASNGICYVETRYCPQLFAKDSAFTAEDGLKAVLEGLQLGSQRFGVKVRSILCAIRDIPEFCPETLRLAINYQPHGVVGVDLAGDDREDDKRGGTHVDIVKFFQDAGRAGLHRTVHAGENSGPGMVREALTLMGAERIGHGYRAVVDSELYQHMLHRGIHFELCPLSSHLTSAVTCEWNEHPILRLAADRANYSINTDDATFTGQWLNAEYHLCLDKIGLHPSELVRANYSAARSCFLPDDEKEELIHQLNQYYRRRL